MKFKLSDKRILIPFVIALVGTVIMAVSVFLPYATATDSFRKEINELPDTIVSEQLNLTTYDLENRSMVGYARLYSAYSIELFYTNEGYLYAGMVIAIAVFALLGVLFTIIRKATPTIVFTCLSFLVFAFHSFDFSFRGEIPSENYVWGFGYYIFYIATLLALVGAVWLLVTKHKIKKENKTQE